MNQNVQDQHLISQDSKDTSNENPWQCFVLFFIIFAILNDVIFCPAITGVVIWKAAMLKDPSGAESVSPTCHCCSKFVGCSEECTSDHYDLNHFADPSLWIMGWALIEGIMFLPTLLITLIFFIIGIFAFIGKLFMVQVSDDDRFMIDGSYFLYAFGYALARQVQHKAYLVTISLRLACLILTGFFIHQFPKTTATCSDSYFEPVLNFDWNGAIDELHICFAFYFILGGLHLLFRRILVVCLLPLVEREVESVFILRMYFIKTEVTGHLIAEQN